MNHIKLDRIVSYSLTQFGLDLFYEKTWMNANKTVIVVTRMVYARTHMEVTNVTVPTDTAAMVEDVQVNPIQSLILSKPICFLLCRSKT